MKCAIAVGIAALCGFALLTPLPAQTKRSVLDGVYTSGQASRGKLVYFEICAECHGEDLAGDVETRPLAGADFVVNWKGGTLFTLFERIRTTMPADSPGLLKRQEYTDVLAFILQANKYPEGKDELSSRSEDLRSIQFEPPKP